MPDSRLTALRQLLRGCELDALLIGGKANRRYVSGFTGSEGYLLVSEERAALLSDSRYRLQGPREAADFEFHERPTSPPVYGPLLRTLASSWGLRTLGFEAQLMTVAEHQGLREALDEAGVTLQPAPPLLEQLREVKDERELALLRRAIAITDDALQAVLPMLHPDMTERAVAWELEKAMRERGADGLAFEIIVAAGPNGASPHARAGDHPLGQGWPIILDFGARYEGYHADMTRTVVLGQPDERFEELYALVLEAQERAERGIKAGITGHEAEMLAREPIAAAGYDEAFSHSLGHGVGLEIHESPRLRREVEAPLPYGAVVSVEPGIYLEGWGGIRIEDLVLVQEHGCYVLTQSPKDRPVIMLDA